MQGGGAGPGGIWDQAKRGRTRTISATDSMDQGGILKIISSKASKDPPHTRAPGTSCLRHHRGEDWEPPRLRDWSLITGRGGGATKQEGGACEVLALRKGGAGKVLAMLKGETKRFGVVFMR